ncbi:MAG: DUF2334 domain-containing protein [Prosthecobacter sp.]|uniref:DUF2334 domain-containing protein n=1 Tax=Prosthecobacter sp. TaxID=1965333 RepID=UPI0039024A15
MQTVILRDDDTCALTPVHLLEYLYRPWLARGLPVNLATIPNVNIRATWRDGTPEGFRLGQNFTGGRQHFSIAENGELLEYLRHNPGISVAHHGWAHDYMEFASGDQAHLGGLLDAGREHFIHAGIPAPRTFVAPYDQLSRGGHAAVATRFDVFSTGWYEPKRLPRPWLPRYALKKLRGQTHWRQGGLKLLTHPGCILSHQRDPRSILRFVQRTVRSQPLTVLVTHWWEYFHLGVENKPFIQALHDTAAWLADQPDIRVIRFSDLES